MADIRADLSQYYAMKAVFERTLGKSSFAAVKDYAPLRVWKAEAVRLLMAISLAVTDTVEIVDDEWKAEMSAEIEDGISRIKSSSKIDDLFAGLSATLSHVVFLQLGFLPRGHYRIARVPLARGHWKLDVVRSVQYVQSRPQRIAQKRLGTARKRDAEA